MNKKTAVISVLIAVLFASSIAGTAFYYKVIVNSDNSKIASLNTETANLTNQLSNLESQMPANLVTNLNRDQRRLKYCWRDSGLFYTQY
jgi:peptidoglycan hydrolase CwlO-like protein